MLRNLNISSSGKRDSSSPKVGVLASEIPTGFSLPPFLLNDVDSEFPNRRYSLEILTMPSAGLLYLNKAGAGSFTGAPDGTYTGTQRVRKYDPGVGLASAQDSTYTLTVGEGGVVTPPGDTTKPLLPGPLTITQKPGGGTIAWQAATDASGILRYEYQVDDGGYISTGTGRLATLSGLDVRDYLVEVRAVDVAGNISDVLSGTLTPMVQSEGPDPVFMRSISRTIRIKAAPLTFTGSAFWKFPDPRRPVGSIDPDATIDITFDWTEVMADIQDTIASVNFDLDGLTSEGAYGDPTHATIFVSSPTKAECRITCEIVTNSTPPRTENRTVYLTREEQ